VLYYEKHELSIEKDWVVFLHGLGGSHTVFYKQIEEFKGKYNLLFIDFPGHGKSQALEQKDHTIENIAKEVYTVLDQLSISRFHLLGFSLGTIIAQEMISQAPNRIKSVILAGAAIEWSWWSNQLAKHTYSIRFLAPYMTFYKAFAFLMMPKQNHKRSRNIFIREASKLGRNEFFKWAKVVLNPEFFYKKAYQTPNSIPKLLVMGSDDHMFLRSAANACEKDPNAELKIIKHAGHVCIIERAEEFNRLALRFLKLHQTKRYDKGA
jgi:pimeloyl-ACP methyl ester carboxylesterase